MDMLAKAFVIAASSVVIAVGGALESFMGKDYHHPSFYFFGAKAFPSSRQLPFQKKYFLLTLLHCLILETRRIQYMNL